MQTKTNKMNHRPKLLTIGSALALALLIGPAAHAGLVLSGSTTGAFEGSSGGFTEINNAADGSFASFRTGVPVDGSFKSGVVFNGQTFSNVHSGDTFALGMITYYNGITKIHTSSATADLDFALNLTDPALGNIDLTTIHFGIDATINSGSLKPDLYTASFTNPAPVLIGDTWVKFSLNDLPSATQVNENTWVQLANVTVTYLSPIPEPSTYGLMGAAALCGVAALRRFRGKRSGPAGPLALA